MRETVLDLGSTSNSLKS